jgi:spore germination protein GerM
MDRPENKNTTTKLLYSVLVLAFVSTLGILFLVFFDNDSKIAQDDLNEQITPTVTNQPTAPVTQAKSTTTVSTPTITYRDIQLFYYNSEADKDNMGNVMCSRDAVLPVNRKIPVSETPIQDTINLLLSGELTDLEKEQSFQTEYPLEGLNLKGANLKNKVLTLELEDPLNNTGGGSCRVGILWYQIEKTALQFDEVDKVEFIPAELFQP